MLKFWHASVAKNTAAQFAMWAEMARGTKLRNIMLCNLDGDNVMLSGYPTEIMDTYRSDLGYN